MREITFGKKNKLFGWRSKTKKYSVTLGAGIHMIDLINWFLGSKPKFVTSFAHNKVTKEPISKNSFNVSILNIQIKLLQKLRQIVQQTINIFMN